MKCGLDYRCPKCGSPIIWSINNLESGASGKIKCSKSITSSRISWDPTTDRICNWTGIAIRQKCGDVKLFCKDGISQLRRRDTERVK
jgi:hypothetical protein